MGRICSYRRFYVICCAAHDIVFSRFTGEKSKASNSAFVLIKITAQSNVRHIALFLCYKYAPARKYLHADVYSLISLCSHKQRKPPDAVVFFVFLPLSDFHRRLLRRTAGARSALTAPKVCGGSIETRLVCDLGLRLQPMVTFFQQVISIFHLVVMLKYTCTERTSLDADRTAFRDMQSGFSLFGSLIGNACAAFDICSLLRKNSII